MANWLGSPAASWLRGDGAGGTGGPTEAVAKASDTAAAASANQASISKAGLAEALQRPASTLADPLAAAPPPRREGQVDASAPDIGQLGARAKPSPGPWLAKPLGSTEKAASVDVAKRPPATPPLIGQPRPFKPPPAALRQVSALPPKGPPPGIAPFKRAPAGPKAPPPMVSLASAAPQGVPPKPAPSASAILGGQPRLTVGAPAFADYRVRQGQMPGSSGGPASTSPQAKARARSVASARVQRDPAMPPPPKREPPRFDDRPAGPAEATRLPEARPAAAADEVPAGEWPTPAWVDIGPPSSRPGQPLRFGYGGGIQHPEPRRFGQQGLVHARQGVGQPIYYEASNNTEVSGYGVLVGDLPSSWSEETVASF